VKLADLGCAKVKSSMGATLGRHGAVGTPLYMAPEVHRDENYDASADVFSYAIMLWELYSGTQPFQGWSIQRLIKDVGNGDARPQPMPATLPMVLRFTLEKCWQKTPAERPKMTTVLEVLSQVNVDDQ